MDESKDFFEVMIPENYHFRYTLSFMIGKKALIDGKTRREIKEELLNELDNEQTAIRMAMLNKYIGEKGEYRSELSEERKAIIANYFGLPDANYLLTEWVKQALETGV